MRNNKTQVRRLAIHRVIVRTLLGPELTEVAAGWECSARTSGNIVCSGIASGDPDGCESAQSP